MVFLGTVLKNTIFRKHFLVIAIKKMGVFKVCPQKHLRERKDKKWQR